MEREKMITELSKSHKWLFQFFKEWFYEFVNASSGCEPSKEYEWQALDFFKRYVHFTEKKTKRFTS